MEQLNRVHIRGTVGTVRVSTMGEKKFARLAVATNFAYRDKDGCAVIETTWHNVTVWEGDGRPDPAKIEKGAKVDIVGRIRSNRYTTGNGEDRYNLEIVANSLTVLDENEPLQLEM